MDLKYRFQQFWQLIHAPPLPAPAWEEIESILTPAEVALFRQHSVADRRHAYRVLRTLRAGGHDHPALLAAALLHDVGKTRYRLRLWERIAGALADICCPGRVKAWGSPRVGSRAILSWRRPFIIRQQHPQWGAEMAAEAGSAPLVVTLVRHHQDKASRLPDAEANGLLHALQWADDQN